MTKDEALEVCKIMISVESGCSMCAREMLQEFVARFPEHRQVARKLYAKEGWGELMEDVLPGDTT